MTSKVTIPEVKIEARFRGPPQSGNGGYVSGTFAAFMRNPDHDVEVTLRSPIPLDKAMQVHGTEGGVAIMDGETLIAEVKAGNIDDVSPPSMPDWEATRAAEPTSWSHKKRTNSLLPDSIGFHPICFCCGVQNEEGLHVFPAAVGDQVAAIWETKTEWADEDGNLPASYLWTAMDCPGQFAFLEKDIITGLLGRMTARILKKIPAGESYMVSAWTIEVEGKKHFAGSAIFTKDGELVSFARTVWIGRRE